MTVTITHTHEHGTLVDGTARGDGSAEILKRHGFRWGRSISQWYIAQSRDHDANTWKINGAADALRAAGFTVEVSVDNTARAAEDRYDSLVERSLARADALDAKSDRLAAESQQQYDRYRQTADLIPLGQPILVGHHSERRHRRDLERMDRAIEKSAEAQHESDDAARRADSARHTAASVKNVGLLQRKIARTEALLRDVERKLAGNGYHAPADGEWRNQLLELQRRYTDEIDYLRRQVKELEDAGVKVWGPSDFKVGDLVRSGGSWYRVVRVNKTTLTVDWSDVFRVPGHTGKVSYTKVQDRKEGEAA